MSDDDDPCVGPLGQWVYFGSKRASGRENIWMARRPSGTGPFEAPTAVDSVNTGLDDDDPWVAADERYMVFSSDRDGDVDLYETFR